MSDPVDGWVPAKRFGVRVVTSLAARRRNRFERRSAAPRQLHIGWMRASATQPDGKGP